MKKNQSFVSSGSLALVISFLLASCSKGGGNSPSVDPCAGITVSVTATTIDADAGTPNGSIAAAAVGGSRFTFSLNSGSYQASGNFSNLSPGTYSVSAKNEKGCVGTASFTIGSKDACLGKSITVTPTVNQNADPCENTGIVSVTATGSSGFAFNVDNGTFQASANFSNLSAGSHTFGAKDNSGCFKAAAISVPPATAGAVFLVIKSIIQTNCAISGCHAGTQAPNFTVDCNIVFYGDRIKFRAVDEAGTANQMPQPPRAPLSQSDRDKITSWFNMGHHYSN